MSLLQETLEAARLRLRPIVMTSLAFGFGVVPLALSQRRRFRRPGRHRHRGARRDRHRHGTRGVLVPLFFLVVGRLFRLRKAPRTGNSPQIPTEQA